MGLQSARWQAQMVQAAAWCRQQAAAGSAWQACLFCAGAPLPPPMLPGVPGGLRSTCGSQEWQEQRLCMRWNGTAANVHCVTCDVPGNKNHKTRNECAAAHRQKKNNASHGLQVADFNDCSQLTGRSSAPHSVLKFHSQ